jgi:peptidoglycan hydrolase-like protein with peptidoglycan-binding domain
MNAQVNQNNVVWPVPGRTKINESDVPIEGDGHFGYTRTNADGSPKFHAGIDIEGRRGDSVVSFKEGKVTFAGQVPGYGYSIMVDHGNGVGSFYAHLDSISVKEGQTVAAGAKIGTLGATGNASQTVAAGGDPHLHFEIVEGYNPNLPLSNSNGQAVDPMKYLNGAQQIGSPSAPSTPSAPASNATLLREGDSGDAVRRLQEALNKNGAQLEADGIFGPLTRAEVERYQASKALMVDGIAGPQTLGALGIGQQQNPGAQTPGTPQTPGASGNATRSSDFGAQLGSSDFRNSSIYLAIGLAEGTIGRDGKPTSAYAGHDDPGNHVLNRGFGSYQVYQHPSGRGAGIGAHEADQIQADRLRKEAWPGIDKALNDAGFKPGPMRDLVAASALDAWNQAPGAVFGDSSGKRYSMMHPTQLADLKRDLDSGKSPQSAITEWRTEGYKRDDGSLAASGFNNSLSRLTDDQARRTAAVADGLSLRPTQAVSQTTEPGNPGAKPPANTPSAPARDIGADIAETAKSWAGKSFKPGETERCQDFVNTVLNQTSPGLANKIGTTRQAQDGLESGEYLASRFSGSDVGKKIPVSEARPGDIVMFKGTYGEYKGTDVITHVGIYVGNGMMVDRPTSDRPVQMRSVNTFGEDNVVVYRPHAYGQTQSVGKPEQGTPTTSPTAPTAAQGMPMLREGDSGPSVRQLQEALNKNGAKLDVDGQFGPLTRAEVERYQRAKNLDADGIVGPKTWGALAQTQQQAPTQPTQPTQPSNGASADFGAQLRSQDLKNTSIYLAIGLAEGTINRNGQPNSAYFGHGDPGNGALNRGFGSYQVQQHPKGEALTAPEADRVQADRLAGQWNRIDKALNEAGFKPGPTRDLIAANALDAWNQAPLTFEDRYGLMNKQQLAELKQKVDSGTSPRDAIVDWRAQSYRDNSGRLDAPGLGNSMERVREDQARRIDAIAEGLQLRPPVREQAQANVQPQVAAQTVPVATAGAVAATASIAATVAAPVTDRTLITHPDHPGHKWHEQALAIVDKLPQGTVSAENRDKAAALIALQVMDDQRLSKMAGVETIGKGLIAVSDQQSVRAANSTVGMVNINGLEGMNLRELSQQIEKLPEAAKREPQIVAPVAPTQPQDTQNLDPKRNNPVLLA